MKLNYLRLLLKSIITVLLLSFLGISISCDGGLKNCVLQLDECQSSIDNLEYYMVKFQEKIYKDSIVISKVFNYKKKFTNTFFIENGAVYDYRYTDHLYKDQLNRLLLFSMTDTVYSWENRIWERDFIIGLDRASTNVIIKKIAPNLFTTTLQSLTDSTYKEVYFYNNEFQILKFEYYYKNSKIVLDANSEKGKK